jgi:predicted enzyme related to lactoylglutathione lyase
VGSRSNDQLRVRRPPLERYDHGMTSQLAVIVIDAIEPRPIAEFWAAVLGWRIVEEEADIISLAPEGGAPPGIDVARVPERKTLKNRLHLDLRADGTTQRQEVERLIGLGARRVDVGQGPDVSWVVLADPEGNEFCVLSRSVQGLTREMAKAP